MSVSVDVSSKNEDLGKILAKVGLENNHQTTFDVIYFLLVAGSR